MPASRLQRALSVLRKLLVVGLITAVVCEIVLRIAGFQPYVNEGFIWQHDEALGWVHKPKAEGVFAKIAFSQDIKINSKGLREREVAYEKPADEQRVLVIGDSGVVGFEVPLDAVFPRIAEKSLRSDGLNVKFINAGCRGWGTDQALIWLATEGVKYKPDLVLYHFNRNDIADNWTLHRPSREYGKPAYHVAEGNTLKLVGSPVPRYDFMSYVVLDEDGATVEKSVPKWQRTTLFLRTHVLSKSALLTAGLVIGAWATSATKSLQKAGTFSQLSYATFLSDTNDRKRLKALLVEMNRVSEAAGAQFFVSGEDHKDFLTLLNEVQIEALGARTRFWKVRKGHQTIVPFDTHPNAKGHELFGECMADAIRARKLLSSGN